MSVVKIVVASTRPGRVGLPVARWVEQVALAHGGFDRVEVVDLAEVNLPFLDEPNHPRLGKYLHQHTKDWSRVVDEADAFVFVMPEYNFGFNAVLKNAIDYLHKEWQYKPVGLVSYGGVSGGVRAAQMIKQVLTTLKMTPVGEAVAIPFVHQHVNADGSLVPTEPLTVSADAMFDELVRMSDVLRPLRGALVAN